MKKKQSRTASPKPWPMAERRGACRALNILAFELGMHNRKTISVKDVLSWIDRVRRGIDPEDKVHNEAMAVLARLAGRQARDSAEPTPVKKGHPHESLPN